jgi:uncharacterized protein
MPLHDNTEKRRFEMEENGHIAFADYRLEGNILHIPHVEAPPALRGTGAAGRLMQALADHARTNGLKLHPICGYAAAWLQKHKETHDLVV